MGAVFMGVAFRECLAGAPITAKLARLPAAGTSLACRPQVCQHRIHEALGGVLRRDLEQAGRRDHHQRREDRPHGAERPERDRWRLSARLLRQRGRRRQLRGRQDPGRRVRVRAVPQRDRQLPVPRAELRAGRRDLHHRLQPWRLHGALGGRNGRAGRAAHQVSLVEERLPTAVRLYQHVEEPTGRLGRGCRGVPARPLPPGQGGLPRRLRHRGRPRRAGLHAAGAAVPRRTAERPGGARPPRAGDRRDPAEVRAHLLGGARGICGRDQPRTRASSRCGSRARTPTSGGATRRPGCPTRRCSGWRARPTTPAWSSTHRC